jgi:hypothetical protein
MARIVRAAHWFRDEACRHWVVLLRQGPTCQLCGRQIVQEDAKVLPFRRAA